MFSLVLSILGLIIVGLKASIDILLYTLIQQFTERNKEIFKLFSEAGITLNLDAHTFEGLFLIVVVFQIVKRMYWYVKAVSSLRYSSSRLVRNSGIPSFD